MHLNRTAGAAACGLGLATLLAACTNARVSSVAPSDSKCQVDAAAEPAQFGPEGGRGTVRIRAARDCGWTVAALAAWIAVTASTDGQGDALVPFTVAANPRPVARAGDLRVEDATVGLAQAGAACRFTLDRRAEQVSAAGGRVTFQLQTLDGCAWDAASSVPWLTILRGRSGNTSETVDVRVDANAGAARSGTLRVAGETFTVTQDGATGTPTPGPTPTPPPSPVPQPEPVSVRLEGLISDVSGVCPAVRFTLDGYSVRASSRTDFEGRCAHLSDGDTVRVEGLANGDRTVDATAIELKKNAR